MVKNVVLVEFYFSAKLLKSTFKQESKECPIDSFSTGLVGEGIFRAGLKQKSPVLREQAFMRSSYMRGNEAVTDPGSLTAVQIHS